MREFWKGFFIGYMVAFIVATIYLMAVGYLPT